MKKLYQLLKLVVQKTVRGECWPILRYTRFARTQDERPAYRIHERAITTYSLKIVLFSILLPSTIQPFRPNFDIDDMDTRMPIDDQEQMGTTKTKDLSEPAMPPRKPLRRPAHLSPMERSILDTFERQLAPLADGLNSLTASPEARQAREAKLKEREARAKESLKHRSEDRRWWQPSDSPYRPSHRGGFSDFSGDGWRPSTSPRIPSYWTPPTTGSSDSDFGYSPSSSRDAGGTTDQQPGLTPGDNTDDDNDDTTTSTTSDESGGKKSKSPSVFTESKEGKKIGEHLDTAINTLSNAVDRIEKLNLPDKPSDKTAQRLIDQDSIKDLSKALKKAEKEVATLSEENKKAFNDKNDALQKQQKRAEDLYPHLLPHALRAATMPTDDEDIAKQQRSIKRFIEQHIADKVSVATINNALRARQEELVAQMPKAAAPAGVVTRSIRGKAPATDARITYIQRALKLMPTGRGDHPDAGRDNLIKLQHAIEAEIAAAEKKAAEEAPAPVVKAAAPVAVAPGDV